jgi:4-hydroxybenzoate polyprenyltransferase
LNWQVAFKLGRVSNLPTVWTNTPGAVLAGAISDARVPWLVALSLCYIAGMSSTTLSIGSSTRDTGRATDCRGRSDRSDGLWRALRDARDGRRTVGLGRLRIRGRDHWRSSRHACLGATIVFYDWHHKQNVLSPIVAGLAECSST